MLIPVQSSWTFFLSGLPLVGMVLPLNPRDAFELMKKLLFWILGIILGLSLLQHLILSLDFPVGLPLLVFFILASPVAYFIRAARMKEHRERRSVERTPLVPHHIAPEEDEQ